MHRRLFLGSVACLALACTTTSKGPLKAHPSPSAAQTALEAGDFLAAASRFTNTCQQNPLQHVDDCLQAGTLWIELQRWEEAEHVLKPIANPHGDEINLEASFFLALSHYERDQLDAAAALLKPIAQRNALDSRWRLRAQTEYAICLLEQGERNQAQRLLEAVATTTPPPVDELGKNAWAKAKFYLAEMAFLRFAESPFCNQCSVNLMAKDVEKKVELLWSAQELFVQTIQTKNNHWAIAAGMRIGELYETLYQQLLDSPLPLEIKPDEHESYRREMRKRLRSLLGEALQNYEDTLHTAERIGTTGFFAKNTRERLLRLTRQLLDEPEDDSEAPSK
jgi:tetratricopeptide (TPR) repeat protein